MRGIKIVGLVFKKELKDIFRDRRTVVMATLIPMLLFPLLFFIIGMSLDKTVEKAEENMTVAIIDGGDSSIARFL